MLASVNKLTKTQDFERVKNLGTVFQGSCCALVVAKAESPSSPPRFGFIVSTKIHKNASVRNRAKRALDEGARQQVYRLKKGYDCVVLAKPIIVKTYTTDIMRELEDLVEKADLIEKK